MPAREGRAHFAWLCRDVQNNLHVYGYDGGYRRIPAKEYLSAESLKLDASFAMLYPDIPMPSRNFGNVP
jgi:hypothetical protein